MLHSCICGEVQLRTTAVVLRTITFSDAECGRVSIRRVFCYDCNVPLNSVQFRGFSGSSISTGIVDFRINRPSISLTNNIPIPAFNFYGYTSVTPAYCNLCLQSAVGCLPTPNFPLAACIPLILRNVNPLDSVSNTLSWVQCIINDRWLGYILCGYDLYSNCFKESGNRKK